ncbi:hypothetical protein WR25_24222 [Diploscapter pachys]|uniref:Helicase C-terminal domain-containing protein n=1 Tax=Diploscapter pachys TaxID=2018661 RepID=A0A2A2KB21_9BILA|nr:hypothetical protein WR25_24222 [Diploscapter pachys]
MFQAGEVDYLVATDAIGMGLNMDVAHVAFAGLHKFDGRRTRRLTVAEMAQIAGRAGRHQRDGTFGGVTEEGPGAFLPEEVFAIEEHRFPPIGNLYWRNGEPDFASIDALIASLERRPEPGVLLAAPQATDLAVLKRLADETWVRDRVRSPAMVKRLWAACGLPDFRKLGLDPHARFVSRVFTYLSEGRGVVPNQWFADEERLSDGLHASLTQRFVDKRTTALIRQIGADASLLPVTIGPEGEVLVEDHPIGRLDGFRFTVDPAARAADRRLLLAAAEKRLVTERGRRGEALAAAEDAALTLVDGMIVWNGHGVAKLTPGRSLARPQLVLERDLDCLAKPQREAVQARLVRWFDAMLRRHVPALIALADMARDPQATPALRVVAGELEAAGGLAPRIALREAE